MKQIKQQIEFDEMVIDGVDTSFGNNEISKLFEIIKNTHKTYSDNNKNYILHFISNITNLLGTLKFIKNIYKTETPVTFIHFLDDNSNTKVTGVLFISNNLKVLVSKNFMINMVSTKEEEELEKMKRSNINITYTDHQKYENNICFQQNILEFVLNNHISIDSWCKFEKEKFIM